ncbi:MAG: DUF2341 domain-containing protein, partial [Chitinivibrionales bacterium]|nr:DUF2341 domain-containing protein [Chitinivibrionales bacterium]
MGKTYFTHVAIAQTRVLNDLPTIIRVLRMIKSDGGCFGLFVLVLLGISQAGAQSLNEFAYKREITIQTSTLGLTEDVVNFPLLIRVTDAVVFAGARGDAKDTRFAKTDGTLLSYEIERWDSANAVGEIWVRVDTVYQSDDNQKIVMYWGKSSIETSLSDGSAVFNSSNNYVGVWHMQNTSSIVDATGNATSGSHVGVENDFDGAVARGGKFVEDSARISVPAYSEIEAVNLMTSANPNDGFSFEFWVYPTEDWTASDGDRRIINKGSHDSTDFSINNSDVSGFSGRRIVLEARHDDEGYTVNPTAFTNWDSNTWYYLTYADNFGAKQYRWYINGGEDANSTYQDNYVDNTDTPSLEFGQHSGANTQKFAGTLDEIRISNIERSSSWVELNYETQKIGASVLSFGTIDSATVFGTITIDDGNGITDIATPKLDLTYTGADSMRFALEAPVGSATWVDAAATYSSFDISSSSQGKITIYAQFKNTAGDTSVWVSDTSIYDTEGPTVTVNQAGGQADPTNSLPIVFDVNFNETVINFSSSDITFSGTATGITHTISGSGSSYQIDVTAITGAGTVVPSIGAGVLTDLEDNPNDASTSTDNSVTFDNVNPTVTINQAGGQADPANSFPITYTVTFSEAVSGFEAGDITVGGTASGVVIGTVSGSGANYTVPVSGATGVGTIILSIDANKADDQAGNPNTASTGSDNQVTFDNVSPSSSISTTGDFPGASWPGKIAGSASDNLTGVALVEVSIQNQTSGNYWNGSSWVVGESWNTANGTTSWEYTLDGGNLADATYALRSRATDNAGNVQTSYATSSFRYDNTAPAGTFLIVDRNGYTKNASAQLSISGSGADSMLVTLDTRSPGSWKPFAASYNITISGGGEGKKLVHVRFKDDFGNTTNWQSDSTIYDATLPASSIATSGTFNSATWTGSITGSASDNRSGVDTVYLQVKRDNGQSWSGSAWGGTPVWLKASGTTTWSYSLLAIDLQDDAYTVIAYCVDKAGNAQTPPDTGLFAYDNTGPANVIFDVVDQNGVTADPVAGLTVSAAGAQQMRIALAGSGVDTATLAWKAFSPNDSINIASVGADQAARVLLQLRDSVDNRTAWAQAITMYDITAPTSTILTGGRYNAFSWNAVGGVTGTAADASAGVESVYVELSRVSDGWYWNGLSWQSGQASAVANGTVSWLLPIDTSALTDGDYTLTSAATDSVGNRQSPATNGSFSYDQTTPDGGIELANGANYTNKSKVSAAITTNADSIRYGLAADTIALASAAWIAALSQDSIAIGSGGEGTKIVWIQFKDNVGNISGWRNDQIAYDTTGPTSTVTTSGVIDSSQWLGVVEGTATDALAGINKTEISIYDQSNNRYWNGSSWAGPAPVWISTGANVNWTYALPASNLAAATYTVQSRTTDNAGNVQSTPGTATFTIFVSPVANFSPVAPVSIDTATAVQFVNLSTGSVDSVRWLFGDGTASTENNPAHTYKSVDQSYSCTLIVFAPNNISDTLVRPDLIFTFGGVLNPLRITARYLDLTSIEITLTGY